MVNAVQDDRLETAECEAIDRPRTTWGQGITSQEAVKGRFSTPPGGIARAILPPARQTKPIGRARLETASWMDFR